MDLKTNVERVEHNLYYINGCDYNEAVAVIEVVRQRAIAKMNAQNQKMKGGTN